MIEKLKKLNNSSTLAQGAVILFLSQFVSKLLGLVKNRVLSSYFGATIEKDVFDAAFLFPDTIFSISSEFVLSFAFLPIFALLLTKKGRDYAENFAANILTLVGLTSGLLGILFFIFAPQIQSLIAPDIAPEMKEVFVRWSRMLLPSGIILSISSFLSAKLLAKRQFLGIALAPIIYNVGIIFGVLVFSDRFGVNGIIAGVIGGSIAHLLVQLTSIRSLIPSFYFSDKKDDLKTFFKLALPFVLFSFFLRKGLDFIISQSAFKTEAGSFAAYNYAYNIFAIPGSLVGVSIAQSVYSELVGDNFKKAFRRAIGIVLFLSIPASFTLFILRAQLVRILYGGGNFDWNSTILTLQSLAGLSLGLVGISIIPSLNRLFYAKQKPFTPILAFMIANLVLLFLVNVIPTSSGVFGLSLSLSAAYSTQAIFMLWKTKKVFLKNESLGVKGDTLKNLLSSVFMSIGMYGTLQIWDKFLKTDRFLLLAIQTGISSLLGLVIFMISSKSLRVDSYDFLEKKLRSFLEPKLRKFTNRTS